MNQVLAQATNDRSEQASDVALDKAELAAKKAEIAAEKARLAAEKAQFAAEKAQLAAEQAPNAAAQPAQTAPAATTEIPPASGEVQAETAEAITEGVSKTLAPILEHLDTIYSIFAFRVFSYQGLVQLGFVLALGLTCWFLQRPAGGLFDRMWTEGRKSRPLKIRTTLRSLIWPILFMVALWIAVPLASGLGYGNHVLRIAANLVNAWIFIRLISSAIRDPFWSKTIAVIIWIIAALNILRLLNPTIALLDSIAITIGDSRFSLYLVIKGGLIAVAMLWFAATATQILQSRLTKSKKLTPSVKVLIGQLTRFGLLFLAFVVVLNAVGIDLTALAVLSGAIGVGIGFGLQKIVSNLISGIILLVRQVHQTRRRHRHQRHYRLGVEPRCPLHFGADQGWNGASHPERGIHHQPGGELVPLGRRRPPQGADRHPLQQRPDVGERS